MLLWKSASANLTILMKVKKKKSYREKVQFLRLTKFHNKKIVLWWNVKQLYVYHQMSTDTTIVFFNFLLLYTDPGLGLSSLSKYVCMKYIFYLCLLYR